VVSEQMPWLKGVLIVFIFATGLVLFPSSALAKVTDYVTKDNDGNYYQYDYDQLLESYAQYVMGGEGTLYQHYSETTNYALLDHKKGYIDYDDVLETYARASFAGKSFDMNTYTASGDAKSADMPDKLELVSVKDGDQLDYKVKNLDSVSQLLEEYNQAQNSEEMAEALEEHGEDLNLNLEAYHQLNSYGQERVTSRMVDKRPDDGFETKEEIAELLEKQTEKAREYLDKALKAVNQAEAPGDMEDALKDYEAPLEIDLEDFHSLESYLREKVTSGLIQSRPSDGFPGNREVKEAFQEQLEKAADAAEILKDFNQAQNSEEIAEALEEHGEDLNLNLEAYHQLNSYGQERVTSRMVDKRPDDGFTSLKEISLLYEKEVEETRDLLEDALEEVNSASNPGEAIDRALDQAEKLEIDAEAYENLGSSEQEQAAEYFFEQTPFTAVDMLQTAFHLALQDTRSNMEIEYIDYFITLEHMLDLQMDLSTPPQTDLYGDGWQDADREDVIHYLDPNSFINFDLMDEEEKVIQISLSTSSTLNVREKPTTSSDIVTSVHDGQVFLVKDEAEAKECTDSGTEGIWYRIESNNEKGWVCGEFVTQTISSIPGDMYQFLDLSTTSGVSKEDLGEIVEDKGTLDGTEEAFLEGSGEYDINEIFLVSLALHESGHGQSELAQGMEFEDKDDLFEDEDYVTVYNMFGIGAYDDNPNYYGARRAYRERWFTPEDAVRGGAEFAAEDYIHNQDHYRQHTLYQMKWNRPLLVIDTASLRVREEPTTESDRITSVSDGDRFTIKDSAEAKECTSPGSEGTWYLIETNEDTGWVCSEYTRKNVTHQYATDMGWAAKQVGSIKELYDQVSDYQLKFDIPRYRQED